MHHRGMVAATGPQAPPVMALRQGTVRGHAPGRGSRLRAWGWGPLALVLHQGRPLVRALPARTHTLRQGPRAALPSSSVMGAVHLAQLQASACLSQSL